MLELIGLILPMGIDFINIKITNSKVRFIVSLLVCILVAFVIKFPELKSGEIEEVLKSAGLIFGQAQVVYKLYWENSQARVALLK